MLYLQIGRAFFKLNNFDESIKNYKKFINIIRMFYEDDYYLYIIPFYNIGLAYYNTGKYELSLKYLFRVLSIIEKIYGEKYNYLKIYNIIGMIYLELGVYKKAIDYCKKAISYYGENCLEYYRDAVSAYYNLAIASYYLANHTDSLQNIKNAREILERIFGKNSIEVYSMEFIRYKIHNSLQQYNEAIDIIKPLYISNEISKFLI